jgi:hypothetical protein
MPVAKYFDTPPKDAFEMDHPRIMLLKGEEKAIMKSVKASPVWAKMHQTILDECDKIIPLPPIERIQIGRRLHGQRARRKRSVKGSLAADFLLIVCLSHIRRGKIC